MTPDQADRIVRELDDMARKFHLQRYGLPVYFKCEMVAMTEAVLRIANEKPPDEWAAVDSLGAEEK